MAYSLARGAAHRLAQFKREAANGKWIRPMTWRDVRFAKLNSSSSAGWGKNGDVPVWCAFDPQFPREKFADEIVRLNHSGWFTDDDQSDTARGIVALLPHGRCLAGYYLSMNDERVYFLDVHDTPEDAARMADEHARVIGEQESAYQEKWREARDIEESIDADTRELSRCLALRHHPRLSDRDAIAALIEKIRDARSRLETEFKDYQ